MSHSTRVRGLKSLVWILPITMQLSHSTRVRGLKFIASGYIAEEGIVALYTSAWIEMLTARTPYQFENVALYTSAWIEITYSASVFCRCVLSHSTRVRGLKYSSLKACLQPPYVALYTSAWIEITDQQLEQAEGKVALYTSAWIEIVSGRRYAWHQKVALYTSAWIEISLHEVLQR